MTGPWMRRPFFEKSATEVTHGGLRPFHQKSTCLTQLTLGPCVVHIWTRNPPKLLIFHFSLGSGMGYRAVDEKAVFRKERDREHVRPHREAPHLPKVDRLVPARGGS